jgi:hypothetical protein
MTPSDTKQRPSHLRQLRDAGVFAPSGLMSRWGADFSKLVFLTIYRCFPQFERILDITRSASRVVDQYR